MRYNQFDFEAALESMDSVNLCPQGYRCIEAGEADFVATVLEAYEDMYAALEAGDLEDALDIYGVLEEMADEVEEDPDLARKVKRKAFMKKVGKGAIGVAALGHVVRGGIKGKALGKDFAGSVHVDNQKYGITDEQMKKLHTRGGIIAGGILNTAHVGAAYGAYHLGKSAYDKKKARDKAKADELEAEAQESYFDYYFGG